MPNYLEGLRNDFTPPYLYEQYKSCLWVKKFFEIYQNQIVKNYFERLNDYMKAINVVESDSSFLTFYTRYLFGLHRPLGGASIQDFYDIGKLYDEDIPNIYDDATSSEGLITRDQYYTYIKYIYNYSQESWTPDYMARFIAEYCGDFQPNDIAIKPRHLEVTFILPNSETAKDFLKVIEVYGDEMGLPFKNIYNFKIKQSPYITFNGSKIEDLVNHPFKITITKGVDYQFTWTSSSVDVEWEIISTDSRVKVSQSEVYFTFSTLEYENNIADPILVTINAEHPDEGKFGVKVWVYLRKQGASQMGNLVSAEIRDGDKLNFTEEKIIWH